MCFESESKASHDNDFMNVTRLIRRNGPSFADRVFDIAGSSTLIDVTFSSQLPITAEWIAVYVKVNGNEFLFLVKAHL